MEHRAELEFGLHRGPLSNLAMLSRNAGELADRRGAPGAVRTLTGRRLTMTVTVSNPTAADLPYGFGIHPYFGCLSLRAAELDRTRVVLPASQSSGSFENFLPTGEIRPVDARLDFRRDSPWSG